MGSGTTLRNAAKRFGDEAVDRWLGIDSAAPVPHERLEFGDERADEPYQATNWMALLWVQRTLERFDPTREDTFVEFGAGKGRVVLVAAGLPFGSVVGVELSESLAAVARTNIDRNRSRLVCADVRIEQADMAAFPIPDDMAVAFFYNPGHGEAFLAALAHIRDSLARRPRRFRLVYGNPVMHDEVTGAGFRVAHRPRFINWNVYAWAPPGRWSTAA